MIPATTRALAQYTRTEVQSGTPLQLVVKLYDTAIVSIIKARDGLTRGDLQAKREGMSRGMAVVAELQNSLDLERGGPLAAQLDSLYSYVTGRLIDANVRLDPQALDEAYRLLSTLREGWQQIASSPPAVRSVS
jgi:flagellar secretion chaperone FliS